jgi:hypothetical protein
MHIRGFSVAVSRLARNDRFMADVILRSGATKNLVHGEQRSLVQRTRCFAEFSLSEAEWAQHDIKGRA